MKRLLIFSLLALISNYAFTQKYALTSPDGKLTAGIEIDNGIYVALLKGRNTLFKLGNISLENQIVDIQNTDYKVQRIIRNSVSEIVRPQICEKAAMLENSYNELEMRFNNKKSITFRLFNDGLAYRLSTSFKDSITVYSENLNLYFDGGDSVRLQSSESFNSAWETPYENRNIAEIERNKLCNLPLLVKKRNGSFVMVTESDLYDYPGMWLKGAGQNQFLATHPQYPRTLTVTESAYTSKQVAGTHNYIGRVNGTRTYPWRIFAVAANEKELIANNMVYLLASPCAIDDVSWIKPGVVMFDWWAKYNIYGVDFKSGINTETAKYFIDFCSEHGFRYFLFDDGWSERHNILITVPELNIAEVTAYGRSKGVDIMLWVVWHQLEKNWEQAFNLFEEWGIKGIKVDFMNRDDQPMVRFYERVAKEAARRKMVVDFHGAYKPCGLRRKYPNVLTREALIEFEYNGWTNSDSPVHHNLLPYIRMFTGPMDYIPATMRNSTKDNFRPVGDYPMGQGTRAHSMALFVILNSPMTMLPDSPSDYYREKECAEFLAKIPLEWDETKLLEGRIGKYTVLARRSGDEWYIGAITDWNERNIDLKTDFLQPGKYRLESIEDGINANHRAEDYKKIEKEFQAGDILNLKLASGGGWVAVIVPM